MNLFEKLKNNRNLVEQSSGQGSLFGGLFGGEERKNRRGRQKGSKNKTKVVSNTVQTKIDFDEPRKKELANKVSSKKEKLVTRVKVEREKRRALKTGSDGRRARRQNPTTKKTVSQVKSDIDFQDSLKKAGGSGDIGYDAPDRASKVAKRTTRASKQRTPDPFDIDTSKAAKQNRKIFKTPTKSDMKILDKYPGGYRAPKGEFGPGLTKGQANALRMDKRAFKVTQPSDIRLPKSFRKFSRDLQDFKDRDLPGGPKKTVSPKTSSKPSGSRYDPDVGMATDDTPRRRGVKQSEVSKSQKAYTKAIDKKRRGKRAQQILTQIRKKKRAQSGVNPQVVTKTPFDRSKSRRKSQGPTANFTDTNKPISYKRSGKVSGSKGIGNMYRGADGLDARRNLINRQITDAGAFSSKTRKFVDVTSDAGRVKGKYRQIEMPFDTPSGAQGTPPKVTKLGKFRKLVQKAKKSPIGKAAKFVSKIPGVKTIATLGAAAYAVNQYGKINSTSGSGTTNKKSTELKLDNPNDVTRTTLLDKKGKKIRVPLGSSNQTIQRSIGK